MVLQELVCGTNIRKRNMTTESWERMQQSRERKKEKKQQKKDRFSEKIIIFAK